MPRGGEGRKEEDGHRYEARAEHYHAERQRSKTTRSVTLWRAVPRDIAQRAKYFAGTRDKRVALLCWHGCWRTLCLVARARQTYRARNGSLGRGTMGRQALPAGDRRLPAVCEDKDMGVAYQLALSWRA